MTEKMIVDRARIIHKKGMDPLIEVKKHSNQEFCSGAMYEINPVYGCEFQCQYCGVYSLEDNYFSDVVVYDGFLDYFEKYIHDNIDKLTNNYFYFSAKVDCFQEVLIKNGMLLSILKILRKYNLRYFMVTKGKLPPADIQEEIIRSRDLNQMIISCSMADEKTRMLLEPYAATIEERLDLARFCKENKVVATGSCSPIFPDNYGLYILDVMEKFLNVGIDHFFLHFVDGTKFTFDRLIELVPQYKDCILEHYFKEDSDTFDWYIKHQDITIKKILPPAHYTFKAFEKIKKVLDELSPGATVSMCSAHTNNCGSLAYEFNKEAHKRNFHCVGTRFEK